MSNNRTGDLRDLTLFNHPLQLKWYWNHYASLGWIMLLEAGELLLVLDSYPGHHWCDFQTSLCPSNTTCKNCRVGNRLALLLTGSFRNTDFFLLTLKLSHLLCDIQILLFRGHCHRTWSLLLLLNRRWKGHIRLLIPRNISLGLLCRDLILGFGAAKA